MILFGPESAIFLLFVLLPWVAIRLLARVPLRRAVAEGLFAAYVLAMLVVVFLPLRALTPDDGPYLWANVNLVPTHTMIQYIQTIPGRAVQQLVGNIVLFIPLGFLLPVLGARFRRPAATAAAALAVSVGIELIQLAMLISRASQRSVDVDDIILNVTGAVLGYLAWRVAHSLTAREPVSVDTATDVV